MVMNMSSIDHWVFDLDNTLYPASARLFDQIERKMETYIVRELSITPSEAKSMRADFWHNHGTTLKGLMDVHKIDPDPFLEEVHDIDISHLEPAADLKHAIDALQAECVIYTNGSRRHGENISTARGIRSCFEAIYGIEDASYRPKPEIAAFEQVFSAAGIEPKRAVMVEDDPRNLVAPAAMGMTTILVGSDIKADHIHFHTSDLTGFLTQVASDGFPL